MLHTLLQQYKALPLAIQQFIKRAIIFFIAWKLLYIFVLMPYGQPNKWLTFTLAKATAYTVSKQQKTPAYASYHPDKRAAFAYTKHHNMLVSNGCNGLELLVLYVGFILCFGIYNLRTLVFAVMGTVLIYGINIGRAIVLFFMQVYDADTADIAHKYYFQLAVYAAIFSLWYWYTLPYKHNTATHA